MDELYLRYKSIAVFSGVAARLSALAEFCNADGTTAVGLAARIFREVAESGCDTTGEWIKSFVLADDNVFSRAVASGARVSDRLKAQVKSELLTFKRLSLIKPDDRIPTEAAEFCPRFGFGGFSVGYEKLAAFYAANGCGRLAGGSAFVYRNGILCATETCGARLSDLKNYVEEKAEIVRNTENFIRGLPAFHTLLYGDRGTGKSTTVRAIANEYRNSLKVIELARSDIGMLPALRAEFNGLRQKIILFIDDLAFDENDGLADEFKTALEGSLDSPTTNMLLYCTSNRRHLFKETDKTELRRRGDEVQAELALFDRFGLVITYLNPDREEFIDILKQILRSRGIKWRDEYGAIAELAALKKGGRTPRAAKQIADLIETGYAQARTERNG